MKLQAAAPEVNNYGTLLRTRTTVLSATPRLP